MASPINEPSTGYTTGGAVYPGYGLPATQHPSPSPLANFFGEGRIEALERYGTLAGRLLICQVFLMSGVSKILDWSGTLGFMTQNFGRTLEWLGAGPDLTALTMSALPALLVAATVVELAGGTALLLGFKARLGALALFLFLIPTTLVFHNFWTYPAEEQKQQMIMFMHNLTLMGGLLLVMTFGAGPFSIDFWRRKLS